jgi:hypothetical protein
MPEVAFALIPDVDEAFENRLILNNVDPFTSPIEVFASIEEADGIEGDNWHNTWVHRLIEFSCVQNRRPLSTADIQKGFYIYRGVRNDHTPVSLVDNPQYCFLIPTVFGEYEDTIELVTADGSVFCSIINDLVRVTVFTYRNEWSRGMDLLVPISHFIIANSITTSGEDDLLRENINLKEQLADSKREIENLQRERDFFKSELEKIQGSSIETQNGSEYPPDNAIGWGDPYEGTQTSNAIVTPERVIIFVVIIAIAAAIVIGVYRLKKRYDERTFVVAKEASTPFFDESRIVTRSEFDNLTKQVDADRDVFSSELHRLKASGVKLVPKKSEDEPLDETAMALLLANSTSNYLSGKEKCTTNGFGVLGVTVYSSGYAEYGEITDGSDWAIIYKKGSANCFIVYNKGRSMLFKLKEFYDHSSISHLASGYKYESLAQIRRSDIANKRFNLVDVRKGYIVPER